MTGLEAVLIYIMVSIGGGLFLGTNDALEKPYKSFDNTYLKIIVKRNYNHIEFDSRVHHANIVLRNRPSLFINFFVSFINPVKYKIDFYRNDEYQKYFKTIQTKYSENYFIEECEYVSKMPTNVRFEVGIGIYSLTDSIKLSPNQTLQITMESINNELRPEPNNSKSYEVITTPLDINEIEKCNFKTEDSKPGVQ